MLVLCTFPQPISFSLIYHVFHPTSLFGVFSIQEKKCILIIETLTKNSAKDTSKYFISFRFGILISICLRYLWMFHNRNFLPIFLETKLLQKLFLRDLWFAKLSLSFPNFVHLEAICSFSWGGQQNRPDSSHKYWIRHVWRAKNTTFFFQAYQMPNEMEFKKKIASS